MTQHASRSIHEIKRDAERSRAELAETVDHLRASVTTARRRMAPDAIKAELSDYARHRGEALLDSARRNPLQAAAVGALAAWPLMRLARAIPLPVAMIGAGLFVTGTKSGQKLSRSALDEAGRRAHDLRDASALAMEAVADKVADAAGVVATSARSAADAVRSTASDAADNVARTAQTLGARAADQAEDAAMQMRRTAEGAVASMQDAAHDSLLTMEDAARGATLTARDTARNTARSATRSARTMIDWAQDNPLVIAGLGVLIGGAIASALPATETERQVAGAVGAGVRTGVKAAAAQGMARAAQAVVRAATNGARPDGDANRQFGNVGAATAAPDEAGESARRSTGG